MDNIDKKIISILQKNARMTNADLAEKIGMSRSPVFERVKKLERSGVITKYIALINPDMVGIQCFTYVEVTLIRHGQEAVVRFISSITKLHEVMECHHITGEADFLLKIATRDIAAYEDFILHKLTALPDVQNLKTMVVLSTMKNETSLPVKGE
ncbi:MAG: Lrp/AsnC family transcriptional regulator [Candidatus Heimdallarchaeota archaeon]|jgi:DNA-binding Lrp family transcriptional regulator|nr:Lrp/AsnC family transcriptional regulator [Candidatus Heimdallarchaeota archaeon]